MVSREKLLNSMQQKYHREIGGVIQNKYSTEKKNKVVVVFSVFREC